MSIESQQEMCQNILSQSGLSSPIKNNNKKGQSLEVKKGILEIIAFSKLNSNSSIRYDILHPQTYFWAHST